MEARPSFDAGEEALTKSTSGSPGSVFQMKRRHDARFAGEPTLRINGEIEPAKKSCHLGCHLGILRRQRSDLGAHQRRLLPQHVDLGLKRVRVLLLLGTYRLRIVDGFRGHGGDLAYVSPAYAICAKHVSDIHLRERARSSKAGPPLHRRFGHRQRSGALCRAQSYFPCPPVLAPFLGPLRRSDRAGTAQICR